MENPKRTCDGCTACCDGWLHGQVHGHPFFPGRKCFFVTPKGCSIYKDRPEHPCVSYKCWWLESNDLPMWLRPDLSKVIISKKEVDGIEFFMAQEAGEKLSAENLNYFIQWVLRDKINLLYYIDGGENRLGSQDFLNLELKL